MHVRSCYPFHKLPYSAIVVNPYKNSTSLKHRQPTVFPQKLRAPENGGSSIGAQARPHFTATATASGANRGTRGAKRTHQDRNTHPGADRRRRTAEPGPRQPRRPIGGRRTGEHPEKRATAATAKPRCKTQTPDWPRTGGNRVVGRGQNPADPNRTPRPSLLHRRRN